MAQILLIGAGITSAITSFLLKKRIPNAKLFVWDKAKGAGGRMSTTRNRNQDSSILDLGAQYITVTPEYSELHNEYYKELKNHGLLMKLNGTVDAMKLTPDGTEHYVAPKGTASLVKHFLNLSQADVRFERTVQSVFLSDHKWEVLTSDGVKNCFDAVVITVPVPQILGLSGTIKQYIESNEDLLNQLRSVQYSSRYALGLFYKKGSQIELPGGAVAQYVSNDPIVRFVSIDNVKRGDDSCPSVVIHTSVPFGKANVERTPGELEQVLVDKVREMFPQWPEPESVKCQKWRYSQVSSAFPGIPGAIEIGSGLIASGDAFTHSNMDGCIEAATTAAESIVRHVSSRESSL